MVTNMSPESIGKAMANANKAKKFTPLAKKRALSKTSDLKKPIKEKLRKKAKKGGK